MQKIFLILVSLFTVFLSPAFAESPAADSVRTRAIDTLRQELNAAGGWVKVHAAEALLRLGYPEGVGGVFRQELVLHSDQTQYRIGVWRVLADASVVPKERAEWIEKIKGVFFDPVAPDRMHAAETLGKLKMQLTDAEKTLVEQYAQQKQDPFAFWLLAQSGDTNAVTELQRLKGSDDPVTALRAGLSLEQLHPVSKETWLAAGGRERTVSALKSGDAAERVKACRALNGFGEADERELLVPLLNDPDAGVRVHAAAALLNMERNKVFRIGVPDGLVIAGYFLTLILIGWYYARKTETTEDYLLGGRNMKPWMVGLSLFAALLSTASYVSLPGEMVKHGPMLLAQLAFIPLVIWVVGWFLIPTFMKLRVTSANEILEMRLGLSIRMLGSALFIFSRLAWLSMIIYITAKAVLCPMLGLGPAYLPWMCLMLGLVTMGYTSSGGIKAAVLADVIQSFILYFGAIVAVVLITVRLHGFSWFPTQWGPTWDPPVFWFDTNARVTFMGAGMMMFLWYICTAGSDQVAVQRFLSTKDLKAARSAFNINLLAAAMVIIFLGVLGFALYGYFQARPHELAAGMNLRTDADQIFPHFIVSGLPAGLSGLIISGMLAAGLSSLSAGVSSVGAVITVDFLDRFTAKKAVEKTGVKRARLVSVAVGFTVVGLSLLVSRVPGNFTEVINKLANLLVAPLFVLFFMAIFVRFSNAVGAWAGATVSVAAAVGVAFFGLFGLSFLWILPCSLASGIATGCLVSLLTGGKKVKSGL
jgi:SSS family solute:Na+ symporter